MATANPPPGALALADQNGSDPFVSSAHDAHRHRYAAFENSQFSLYLNGSPSQAKKALEAHLSETTRRLQETSSLGNALVQQRKELEQRLKDVERQQEDGEIGPELRQRLAELEKEFNEVGRETARAFLPKSRVPSGESETTSGAGAAIYASEAHHSPTKVSVPSRKQRNQPSRINDIALATEISTSLLSQLKDLQAVLLEKDEALKAADLDRSQLVIEREGLSQRLRTLDESDSRLKDVNWGLETQVRDFEAQSKAAADREQRLNHALNLARSEKSSLEREFEELKQLYAKLNEDHVRTKKHHETELSGMRRNVSIGETERGALQRKVDELAGQNQELARAVAYRMRSEDHGAIDDTSPSDGGEEGDTLTPDHSPPPSPSKATPRHGQLESETLKHSLHHAHRMIQQLKNNIHREKTEKIELKRMLQDARDELESNRNLNGPGSANKRKKNDKDVFKKPARPDRLGALRSGTQEIVDDDEWEEHDVEQTPSRRSRQVSAVPGAFPGGFSSAAESFDTANETSDAFETANERDGTTTETDAFQTGAETLDGDSSDQLTETEDGPAAGTIRRRPSPLEVAGAQDPYLSTASTSGDEADDIEVKTPIQPQHPRYRLKMRQAYRRSTPRASQEVYADNSPSVNDSPAASFASSNNSTPAQGKSLFAELGDLDAESEDGSIAEGTPSRSSLLSPESPEVTRRSTNHSPLQSVILAKPLMMDSGMMTEPWSPEPTLTEKSPTSHVGIGTEPQTPARMGVSAIVTQDTEPKSPVVVPPPTLGYSSLSMQGTESKSPVVVPPPTLGYSSLSMQDTEPKAPAVAPLPSLSFSTFSKQDTTPVMPVAQKMQLSTVATQATLPKLPIIQPPPPLQMSALSKQHTAPVSPVIEKLTVPAYNMSSIASQDTTPISPVIEKAIPPTLRTSSFATLETTPVEPLNEKTPAASFKMSTVAAQSIEPEVPSLVPETAPTVAKHTPLLVSSVFSQATEPLEPSVELPLAHREPQSEIVPSAPLLVSSFTSQATSPIDAPKPAPPQLSMVMSQNTSPVEPRAPAPSGYSSVMSQATSPVQPYRSAAPQYSTVLSQATEPVDYPRATPPRISTFSSQATEPMEMPLPSSSQLSVVTVQQTEPREPTRNATIPWHNRMSDVMVLDDTQPESPTLPAFLPSPSRPSTATRVMQPVLSYSPVVTQQTVPQVPSRPVTAHRSVPPPMFGSALASTQSADDKSEADKLGFFDSKIPWSQPSPQPQKAGEVSQALEHTRSLEDAPTSAQPPRVSVADEGTQTMVSSEQMDKLLTTGKYQRPLGNGTLATAGVDKALSPPASPNRRLSDPSNKSLRRPGSSGSIRSRTTSPPPLPADHMQQIRSAAASLKSPNLPTPPAASPAPMGPPGIPASAYKKRPQTPTVRTNNPVSSPKTGGTTPRARGAPLRNDTRSGASSPITRRSSVSSFASEIDYRFNITGAPFPQNGLDPNITDPRMIQAITQTMIGEFLWKYTRKTGSGEHSSNRHRRFFWVHPYTRTLYWSEKDPAHADKAESKAKSVAILAVSVETDDNPYPPGLHRKSLVIQTPGREIKFTAPTSQRHETWFNALSYLLMRSGEDGEDEHQAGEEEIQNEFNPGFRSASRQTGRSKASLSSRFSRQTSSSRHDQIPTLRPAATPHQRMSAKGSNQGTMSGRFSSLSGVFKSDSAARNSFSSRRSRVSGQDASVFDPPENQAARQNLVSDLIKQNDQAIEQYNLENVRACCDGKHDVGSLSHTGRHSQHHNHTHASTRSRFSIPSVSSRSHSRADSRRNEPEGANSGPGY